jgi:hypothetical protein
LLVDGVDAAMKAVARVNAFDRATIRATAVGRFGRDRMVDEYVSVYEQVLAGVRTDRS